MSKEADSKKSTLPAASDPAKRRRHGLPDPANVVGESEVRSPKGNRYRIIRTHESDAYDKQDDP